MTLIISIILGYIIAHLYERVIVMATKKDALIIKGYRLHHSLYGTAFLVLGFLSQNIIAIGLGVGIIVQHTLTDGFRFVSKEKQK